MERDGKIISGWAYIDLYKMIIWKGKQIGFFGNIQFMKQKIEIFRKVGNDLLFGILAWLGLIALLVILIWPDGIKKFTDRLPFDVSFEEGSFSAKFKPQPPANGEKVSAAADVPTLPGKAKKPK